MKLIDKLLVFTGKKDFKIDEKISIAYIMRVCWKYGWMMIRGRIFSIGRRNISNNIFVGKHVQVLEKRYLHMESKCKIHDDVYIDALSQDGVILGNGVVLGRGTRIECTGSLQYVGSGIVIGDGTTFGNDCFFGAAGGISVGRNVVAGQFIRFHSENHNYENLNILIKDQGVNHKGIKIGDNCWIGSGVVFLDGASVASGCVIAANAVITKEFPKNSIIGGVPAKIIGYRS